MIKKIFLCLWLFGFLCVQFPQVCKANLNVDLKKILVEITSSVIDKDMAEIVVNNPSADDLNLTGHKKILSNPEESILQMYFPLNTGDRKTYSGTVQGKAYQASYNYSSVYFNGRACYREDDSLDGSQTYYGYSGNEILMYGATVNKVTYPFKTPLPILNETILENGGILKSSTTLNVKGYTVTLKATVTSQLTGTEYIPMGSVNNCRTIKMEFSLSVAGISETGDLEEVWILAPHIGKVKIAVLDQNLNPLGWLSLSGGTVGGINVIDIIHPPAADFSVSHSIGVAPCLVTFTDQSSGMAKTWLWDFGDGSTSSEQNPTHTYQTPGKYTVSLTISGPGGSDTNIKSDYIMIAYPAIDLNNDGTVDINDLLKVFTILNGGKTDLNPSNVPDINGDMKTGMEEGIYMLQVLSHGSHK